jgi:hypothetical protein
VNGHLINNGGSSPYPTVTPGGPTVTPGVGEITVGGEHIWNGLITALVTWSNSTISNLLPEHTSWGMYEWVDNFSSVVYDFAWVVAASGLVWLVPSLICYSIIMTLELIRVGYVILRLIYGLFPLAA